MFNNYSNCYIRDDLLIDLSPPETDTGILQEILARKRFGKFNFLFIIFNTPNM